MTDTATTREQRFATGASILAQIDGSQGQAVVNSLADIAPELGHQIVAYGFGEIYARKQLDFRSRELLTIGVLAALGGCEPQLEVHINAALNVGLDPDEIIEAFLHTSAYAGFPRALNAVFVAKKVFMERGISLPPTKDEQPDTDPRQRR